VLGPDPCHGEGKEAGTVPKVKEEAAQVVLASLENAKVLHGRATSSRATCPVHAIHAVHEPEECLIGLKEIVQG
jgi:hypothetical protein